MKGIMFLLTKNVDTAVEFKYEIERANSDWGVITVYGYSEFLNTPIEGKRGIFLDYDAKDLYISWGEVAYKQVVGAVISLVVKGAYINPVEYWELQQYV